MSEIADQIIAIIAKQSQAAPGEISLESTMDDINIESLDLVEVIFKLEEEFDISIPYNANEAAEFETVGDVVIAVEKLVQQKTAG